MSQLRAASLFRRMDEYELAVCLFCNRGCRRDSLRGLFRMVSRLGDGVFWYALILLLPVWYGTPGLPAAAHMAAVGAAALALYKLLKPRLVRPRPYVSHHGISPGTAPLDRYSFPSGHTLHAVAFSVVGVAHFPELVWLLGPFTLLVAASRVVLGLHYPSDVLAGALLGSALALLSLALTA